MSVDLLERAVAALGELCDDVVFVGAATLPLWISDPGARPLRPTTDVDVVVEVVQLAGYYRFEDRLREARFGDDGVILGRFHHVSGLQIDAIPADASLLGFDNRWQRQSLATAIDRALPSGATIRVLGPVSLLATKLEAFAGRGRDDFLASPDYEDIIALIDGRPALVDEFAAADGELREYIGGELRRHLGSRRARDAVAAHLEFGGGGAARAEAVVVPRLRRLADGAA